MNKFSRRWIAADALSVFEINVAPTPVGCGIGFAKFDGVFIAVAESSYIFQVFIPAKPLVRCGSQDPHRVFSIPD
jgi:hypothetical protein